MLKKRFFILPVFLFCFKTHGMIWPFIQVKSYEGQYGTTLYEAKKIIFPTDCGKKEFSSFTVSELPPGSPMQVSVNDGGYFFSNEKYEKIIDELKTAIAKRRKKDQTNKIRD